MGKILVGSRAFFSDIDGFKSKDRDYVEFVENPHDYKYRKEYSMRGICNFLYKKQDVKSLVEKTIESGDALAVGKFLVPEVARELNAGVQDILPLEPLLDKLDKKHQYERVIFDAIKENGSFEITEEQRKKAYEVYCDARKKQ